MNRTIRLLTAPTTWLLAVPWILTACHDDGPTPVPVVVADPVEPGTALRFTGQITLEGALAEARAGTLEVSVRNVGDPTPVLSRTYVVDDPWRVGSTIAFGLSKEDATRDPLPVMGRVMELVVRFDADGNPRTRSTNDREVVQRVSTGSTDVVVQLDPSDAAVSHASRPGTK